MMRALLLGMVSMATALVVGAAEDATLKVVKPYDPSKSVPISLTGYSGEARSILAFDLEVAGFRLVDASTAEYFLANGDGSRLEGRLSDRTKVSMLAKAYTGGSPRTQAHALADDVVQAITGKPGIARTRIAFKVDTGQNSEIYVSDYDGHGAVGITRDATIVAAPAWGRGNHIFYTSYKLGNPYIFSQDISSGARDVIARHPGMNSSASVSPDGRRVAMILSKSGRPEVYVCDANGGNLKQISNTKVGASSPCWSPDGQKICYSSTDSGNSQLYVISASGGSPQRLRIVGVGNATEPDWSPDGKQIAFATQRGGVNFDICVVSATGGEAEAKAQGEDPSWASNSRTIVFAKRRRDGSRGLSLLDVPTKQVKDIPQILGSNSQPTWAK
jgi:TolB protein